MAFGRQPFSLFAIAITHGPTLDPWDSYTTIVIGLDTVRGYPSSTRTSLFGCQVSVGTYGPSAIAIALIEPCMGDEFSSISALLFYATIEFFAAVETHSVYKRVWISVSLRVACARLAYFTGHGIKSVAAVAGVQGQAGVHSGARREASGEAAVPTRNKGQEFL
ncbi:hypothetical protein PENSPDRAFT_660791 [Peniophora sp. CONT]|nr:hypothetical protein PENSPDRAFT_660791 [Peniophora sp. CONT]